MKHTNKIEERLIYIQKAEMQNNLITESLRRSLMVSISSKNLKNAERKTVCPDSKLKGSKSS